MRIETAALVQDEGHAPRPRAGGDRPSSPNARRPAMRGARADARLRDAIKM
jgi:hypothetical protein